MAIAVATCFAGQPVYGNPLAPLVVNGQATFATSGRTLSITNTPGTIINWQQFSIQANEATRFVQQSASSAVLNRVVGGDPSRILGTLQSNGRVFLINPNGILFGAGAQVDVAGLVASTLNIRNEDFLAGRMNFSGDAALGAAVVNQGRINAANGGRVYLIGSAVDNQGVITAPNGDVVLAAGKSVRIAEASSPYLQVEITAPEDRALNLSDAAYGGRGIYAGLVRNSGSINANSAVRGANGNIVLKASTDIALAAGSSTTSSGADGGSVLLEAGGAIAVTGNIEANGAAGTGGTLVLKAATELSLDDGSSVTANGARGGMVSLSAAGTASVAGTVEAKGKTATGGRIDIAGAQTALPDGARINASGATGGGTILIGGDYQGGAIFRNGAVLPNSRRTFVGRDAELRADAIEGGDGGKVIVWADEATQFHGSISARGGYDGGNGGLVETSGKGWLDFQGQVDTRAPMGATGTLLLDPTDITISTAANLPTLAFGAGSYSDTTSASSNLNVSTLTGQLALSNVTVTTASPLGGNGDITVNNAIDYSSANSLTLSAGRNITIVGGSGGINNSGAGSVSLTGAGTGAIAVNESITTNGGAISLTSGSGGVSLASSKSIDAGTGLITINAGGGAANFNSGTLQTSSAAAAAIGVTNAAALTLGNVALTGGGNLSLTHTAAGTQTAGTVISGNGGLTKAGAGTLTLSQANTYTGTTTVNAGTLTVTGGSAIADTGAVVLANTAGAALNVAAAETIGSLAGGGATGGNVTLATTLTTGNAGSTTYDGVMSGAGGLTKQGTGTFTLTRGSTYTGTTAASGGNLTFSGANGAAANSSAITVASGATVTLDNSAANNNNRLSGSLTMNGGEFIITGNATANTAEVMGALNLASGYSTITVDPNAARNTRIGFSSLTRTQGATALFRGTNLGANTVASQTANSSNIVFTAAPTLTGGGGNAGTNTVSIVGGAIGAASTASAGTDFVTYNPPAGAVNGLRPLTAAEYQADGLAPGANVNYKLTASRSANDAASINSLLLSGGVTYDYDTGAGPDTLTLGGAALSGNVLSLGGSNVIRASRVPGGGVAFGTAEAKVFAVSDLTFAADTPVTGSGGLSKSGAGTLLESRSVALQGGLFVNSGILRSGVNNAFSTAQPLVVRAPGTFDLNGFNHSVTTLSMDSGAVSGANVTTGAGTLTLGDNVTLNVNGTGATGATLSGNLALGATRTFTINNGTATSDLTVSALISGAGAGITKAGTGTLTLSGLNTYTGATTINSGVLSANVLANGGVASSIGQSASAAANLVIGTAAFQYTGGTVSINRNFTLSSSEPASIIDVSNAATNLTLTGAAAVNTGALNKTGSGTLTLAGVNGYTGATTVSAGTLAEGTNNALSTGALIVSGGTFNIGTFTDTVGTVTLNRGTITGTSGVLTGSSYDVRSGTVSSIIGGSGGVAKTTSGTVTLTRANTYAGATTVNAGTLSVSSIANGGVASNIGQSTSAAGNLVLSGGVLQYTGGTTAINRNYTLTAGTTGGIDVSPAATELTLSGASAATNGALTKMGAGTLTLTGSNLNSGTTTISAGTLQVGNGGATGALGSGSVTNIAALTFNRNNALTVANTIGSFGAVTQAGTGTTTLSGANTYFGTTAVNAGTLVAANATALGNALVGTTVANAATLEISNGIALNAEPLSISGNGAGANGALVVTAGSASAAGPVTLNASSSIGGNGSLTLSGTVNDAVTGASTLTQTGSGTLTFGNTVGATNALAAVTTSAGQTTAINGGAVRTTGGQSYGSIVTTSGATMLTSTSGGIITAINAANDFTGDLSLNTTGAANIVDANALALGISSVGTVTAQTLSGNLTVNGAITAAGAGDSIVLAAAQDFVNNAGVAALNPGAGRWLVYSTSPAGSSENGLTGTAGSALPRLYGRTFAGNPPASVAEPGNHLIYSSTPNLTVTPDDKTKIYGTNDPAQTFAAVGFVTDDGVTDTAATAGLTGAFTRVAGETPGVRAITAGTFSSSAGYAVSFTPGSALTITPATVNGTLASNTSKVYGSSDPAAAGLPVTLSGVVNNPAIVTWNGNVAIDDTASVTGALTSLTRAPGENVGAYNYTAGALALSGSAAANYTPVYVPGTNILNITPAALSITANDAQRATGLANPPFAASYSGFQFGETPAVLSGTLAFSTAAIAGSAPGAYAITPFGQASPNYNITYLNGTLTVSGPPPSVTGGNIFNAQLAGVQRATGGSVMRQSTACVCTRNSPQNPAEKILLTISSQQCERATEDDSAEAFAANQCFIVSSN